MRRASELISTRCVVVGGGPAGMMAGFLLARAGVEVMVIEKHRDFLQDFRGDTIHPSTLEVIDELGLLDPFLKRPHQEVHQIGAEIGRFSVRIGDLSHLPTKCKFVALMPQWDFLNFLAEQGSQFRGFDLRMETEATELIEDGEGVGGVRAETPQGPIEIRANLVIAAEGRHSVLREKAGLEVRVLGAPIDVLWMRVSRKAATDPAQALGRVNTGRFFVMLDRGNYWQCAFLIPKGGFEKIRAAGLREFRKEIVAIAPFLADRVDELKDWDDIKLLSVMVDRLEQWYRKGLLLIGDAAHAMSPVGGIGINLAIQDAVAAANILAPALRRGSVSVELLRRVQRRRMFPTRATQRLQILIQNRVLAPTLESSRPIESLPLVLRLLNRWPILARIPARIVGMGFRPEHVQSPNSKHT